jgi:hypothetical protein
MVGILKDLESGKFADSANGFKKFLKTRGLGPGNEYKLPKLEARRRWCIG